MPWRPLPDADKAVQDAFNAKTRILVDESLGQEVASFLREKGCNVVFAGDVGLAGKSDEAIAAYAWRERRMIWTHDRDFLDDNLLPEHRNPGVVVLPGGDGNQEAMGAGLATALGIFGHGGKAWSKTKSTISPNGEITHRSRAPTGEMTASRYRLSNGEAEIWYE